MKVQGRFDELWREVESLLVTDAEKKVGEIARLVFMLSFEDEGIR